MKPFHPRGTSPGATVTRFSAAKPSSYDAKARTVNAIISKGSAVQRFYGTEKLRISPGAVNLDRVATSGIPVLDSHQQAGISNALGRITKTWFTRDALWGTIAFNDTPEGRKAEGMVKRGELAGISAGYTVSRWRITDADGRVLDPEQDRINPSDDLTFEATRELLECSLVSVPADSEAMVRSHGGRTLGHKGAILLRMRMKQRMSDLGIL
jgi:HK97 family phage prohead protease